MSTLRGTTVRQPQGSALDRDEPLGNLFALAAAPIPTDWVLEGKPQARSKTLSCSSDEMAFTAMWDCTAGRFHWFYDIDETVCIMEGRVTVRDATGHSTTLTPGDTFFFPAGTQFHWAVSHYVRKVAFIHIPMSRKMRLARGLYQRLKSVLRPRGNAAPGTASLLKGR